MGMPVDAITLARARERMAEGLRGGAGGVVLTPNLDILRRYQRSPALQVAFERAELLVADGVPLVWASRLQGTPLPARITGTDMLWIAAELACAHEVQLFIAGGRPDVGPRAAQGLRDRYPRLQIATYPCFVKPGPVEPQVGSLVRAMTDAGPGVVLIALPFPAQVCVAATMRAVLPQTWFVGVGSSLDFVTGDRPRAPEWLQRAGLEWAHRVVHQPRMARRYLVQGLPFAARLATHALRTRARRTWSRLPSAKALPGPADGGR
jgi:N-acetylglucosaminyldiphosphoundecaprenol N-acetyl-beta-D-mannosaminyltransferase